MEFNMNKNNLSQLAPLKLQKVYILKIIVAVVMAKIQYLQMKMIHKDKRVTINFCNQRLNQKIVKIHLPVNQIRSL